MSIRVMGVVNVTPDSFYHGSRKLSHEAAIEYALLLADQGANILDIGGESSRPGAEPVLEEEEMQRVIPVIQALAEKTSVQISCDTMKANVARAAVEAGATLINDISGFEDPEMQQIAIDHDVDICIMHMQGQPQTMQQAPSYPHGVVTEILRYLEKQMNTLVQRGVSEKRIIVDPGIGFGKSVEHCLEIIREVHRFKELGVPVLVGASRKSFMQKILGKTADETLSTTLAIHTMAALAGVDILRVHDVVEHCDIVRLLSALGHKK